MSSGDATVLHAGPAPGTPATPSETATAPLNGVYTVPAGKITLGLKRPEVLAEFRMVEAAGPVAANQTWMNMAAPLIYIVEIDGKPVAPPTTKMGIEALVQRLGTDGYKALMKGIEDNFPSDTANPDLVKNS